VFALLCFIHLTLILALVSKKLNLQKQVADLMSYNLPIWFFSFNIALKYFDYWMFKTFWSHPLPELLVPPSSGPCFWFCCILLRIMIKSITMYWASWLPELSFHILLLWIGFQIIYFYDPQWFLSLCHFLLLLLFGCTCAIRKSPGQRLNPSCSCDTAVTMPDT